MARVTVEDCLGVIPNPFDLTVAAAQRARDIGAGASLTIDRDNDKNSVIALREIAQQTVAVEDLKQALVRNLQKFGQPDVATDDDIIMAEESLIVVEEELDGYSVGEAADEDDAELTTLSDLSKDGDDGDYMIGQAADMSVDFGGDEVDED
ncbi:MAG: DNA-directed RNA polymerase subunit omega [Alphaproteobacteria bacterium]|nr:DNA-directed RNA polymerase subunit omega [Alphaproteobacteria bacterium]